VEAAVCILTGLGLFFNTLSILGLFRFPDVYTRLHAATKTTTLATIFIVLAAVLHGIHIGAAAGGTLAIHSLLALAVVLLTNPVGAHAIARASYLRGDRPRKVRLDELKTAGQAQKGGAP
jgi:multicomponent Na+:H+ antiporter subunit G